MWKRVIREFKEFASRGNAIDMAVGIVLGAAFGKIVSSLVDDVLMPPVGMLLQGVDFSELAITLKSAAEGSPAVAIGYGLFINQVLHFVIVAFAMFVVVKGLNKATKRKAKKQEKATPQQPEPPKQEELLVEIRDLLKAQQRQGK